MRGMSAGFDGRVRRGAGEARRAGFGEGKRVWGLAREREWEREAENESLRKSKIAIVIFLNVC